jgi:hypothetical protein
MWAPRLLNWTMPDTAKLRLDVLQKGTYVALMNSHEEIHQQAIAALARNGIRVAPVQRLSSTVGTSTLLITMVQVTGHERAAKVNTTPPDKDTLLPGARIMDFDTAALIAHTDRVFYGPKTTAVTPLWAISSPDPRDHIPTEWQPVSPSEVAAVRITVIDRRPWDPYGALNLVLQKQGYVVLFESGTVQGETSAIVGLPPTTRSIRIALLPNENGFIRFPERVIVQALKQSINRCRER